MSSSPFTYHGQTFEVTVVGCTNLKNMEWFTKQDPYVYLEYGSSRWRTKTCKDGGRNPKFQDKFTISLIEGIKEMTLQVWDSHTISSDSFIGSGKIQLQKLISQGIDDSSWPIMDKRNSFAGEVKLFLYCPALNQKQPNNNLPELLFPPPSPNVMPVVYNNPPPYRRPEAIYPPNQPVYQRPYPPQSSPAAPFFQHVNSAVYPSHYMRDQVFPGSSHPPPGNYPPPGYPQI